MEILKKKIPAYKVTSFLVFLFVYILLMARLTMVDNDDVISSGVVFLYSWVGIIIFLAYIFLWKKLTGKYLTPFTIFLLFMTVFNFGQCFLWAFGIHTDSEIGKRLVYNSVAANNALIMKAQLLYIISYIAVNTGGIILYKKPKNDPGILLQKTHLQDDKYRTLFNTSIITAIFSVPITLYVAVRKLIYTQIYSYHDIYYGSISDYFNNPIFAIGGVIFILSLIGLLIGSKYKKSVMYFTYTIFAIYAFIMLLGGDRGEWVIPLTFLFWMHISFYRPIGKKGAVMLLIVSFVSLYALNAVVSMRNTGLSYEGFTNALEEKKGVIRPALTEFGQTMGISIILLKNETISPYGNTYLMSIPTIIGTGVANRIFGMNYVQLHTWFPLEYLKISYGTDFSIIGEAVLNCGVLLAPVILFFFGLVFGRIFNYPFREKKNPFILCLMINAMICIIGISRSTLWITLNKIFLPSLIFALIYLIVKALSRNGRNKPAIDIFESVKTFHNERST